MSTRLQRNLRELTRSIKTNAPKVKSQVSQSQGKPPDPAVAASTAKYYGALSRLAKE